MNKRVAVALSGGVDSAVSALLLKQQGYEVVGITGKMTNSIEACQVVRNAQTVADKLEIRHYTIDVSKQFDNNVIQYFTNSYAMGQTPNPCIMCNKHIKWGVLFDYAIEILKTDYIATGHYANIILDNGYYKLYPASDEHKDQLYFLFLLNQNHLSKTLFPLSKYAKSEVRDLAVKYNLPPKSSKESQDICFIRPPETTKKYLNNLFKSEIGNFVEKTSGKILGHHNGFWQYTIGQRKGIGIAAPEALYVTDIDAKNNIVYVGYQNELFSDTFYIDNLNFSYPYERKEFRALIKIRYNMPSVLATVIPKSKGWEIKFDKKISAITKGQACVLYDITDGHLIAGGWI